MRLDKRDIIIGLLFVALVIVSVILFTRSSVNIDKEYLESRIKELETEKHQLFENLAAEKKKSKSYLSKIDSIETLKPKIKYVYIEKSKEIDAASVSTIVSEFDNVFTNNGISQ